MRIRRRANTPNAPKFAARAERLDKTELSEGIDQCLSTAGRYWSEWRRNKDRAYLKELILTAEALYTLSDLLDQRQYEGVTEVFKRPARQVRGR